MVYDHIKPDAGGRKPKGVRLTNADGFGRKAGLSAFGFSAIDPAMRSLAAVAGIGSLARIEAIAAVSSLQSHLPRLDHQQTSDRPDEAAIA